MRYHETPLQVRFNEVDAYRVAWRFGIDALQLSELGFLGPVVSLELKFLSPARFNDRIVVRTCLRPTETATLEFLHEIVAADGRRLATGVTTHALTDRDGVMQFRMPPVLSERIDTMTKWLVSE